MLEDSFGCEDFSSELKHFEGAEGFLGVGAGEFFLEAEGVFWGAEEFLRRADQCFQGDDGFFCCIQGFFGVLKNFSTNEAFLVMLKNYLGVEGFSFRGE